jgi:hypothetical protein
VVLVAPALVVLVASGALVWLAQGGWPGQTGTNALEFCETLRPGLVKQPVNTFSNAGFVLVSLLVGWRALRDQAALRAGARLPGNRMTATTFYPAFYAGVAAFLGPGSAALHATTTHWGGRVDVFSMYLWIVWVCVFAWIRLRDGSRSDFLRLYLPAMVVLGVLHFAGWIPVSSDYLFGSFVVLLAALELALRLRRPELRADLRSVAGATALFLLAFAIWIPSRTGGPLCAPDSFVQGHALWHLLCAGSVWLLYSYLRSESLRSEHHRS